MVTRFKESTEEYRELVKTIDSITLVQRMLDPNRKKASDLPRDKYDKIKINVADPHILENTNYFRKSAITFEKYGHYTEAYPSKDPNSPYRKFWDEEKRRCIEGYIRKLDGEWVTGYYYFYLNYCPIMKAEIIGEERAEDGSIKSERIEGFPDFWDGDYLFFHYIDQGDLKGKHGSVLKTRGRGYSYKAAAMSARNYELFEASASYAFASDTEYLDTDGILNKTWDFLNFGNKYIGFAKKLRLKDTMMEKKAGYKKPGDPSEFGFMSSITGVTMKNNPGKARGKRGKLILWEEAGIFPNILKSWRIAQKSMEQGHRIFGYMVAFGTGGEKGANFEGLEALFYKPKAYRVHFVENVYDENIKGQTCGFFHPEYLNRSDCYDKEGNSDVIKAMEEVIKVRLDIKYSATNAEDIAQAKAEEPFTPQEAIMRIEGTVFPVDELKERLAEIGPKIPSFTAPHYIGDLVWAGSDSVTFKPNFNKTPIREWPIKRADTEGAVEIFEMPKRVDGAVSNMRYIGGADTVDDEYGTSLFSIFIMDTFTDNIVAEWTGRFRRASDNFDLALKLAIYYNAIINYENKLKGMFGYFDNKNKLHYLADTPSVLKDMDYVAKRESYGNKAKGTPPTMQINGYGRRLQADWMITHNLFYKDLAYKHIRSIGYIREAISWNINGNFDRISAGIMLFILREDRLKGLRSQKEEDRQEDYDNDPFFNGDKEFTELHSEFADITL